MKIVLMTHDKGGPASNYILHQVFDQALRRSGDSDAVTLEDADRILLIGEVAPESANKLANKAVYRLQAQQFLDSPDAMIETAKKEAIQYPVTAAVTDVIKTEKSIKLVAITACPTGVAHTFMAAEAILTEGARRGWHVRVETRGSVGAATPISDAELAEADLVIVAADIEVDLSRFSGKRLYRTSTSLALKKTSQEFDNALKKATTHQPVSTKNEPLPDSAAHLGTANAYRHLLTGVSYMLPMVVAGGLCIALSLAFGIHAFEQPGSLAAALKEIGSQAALALMVPILAGFIAFSIADRPGLVPGLIGGMLANSTHAGFIGGIVAGFIAGYMAKFISSRLRLPESLTALKPILIIPLVASLVTGLLMIYVVGTPISIIMQGLTHWLGVMGTGNAVLLGAILGGMMCADMGGPINKVAYAFGVGLLSSQVYAPMAAIMAGGMVPPISMGLATLLARRKFVTTEKQAGKAAMVLGLCFISEGAIPFAARDPVRVIPCCVVGGALTGAISMAAGVKLMAPHGGLFVLLIPGAIAPVINYLIAILAGSLLSGFAYAVLKKPATTS